MRPPDKHGHCSWALGQRTSPFISFWYVDLEPLVDRQALLGYAEQQNRLAAKQGEQGKGDQWRSSDLASSSDNKRPIPAYCQEVSKLPKSVQPSEVLP